MKLVNSFYDQMDYLTEARAIRQMHSEDLSESRKKLAYFLSGWLGGPRLYQEHYGPINISLVHRHLNVGDAEKTAWLMCMQKAIGKQPYSRAFKAYLFEQLCVPAERIRQVCERDL